MVHTQIEDIIIYTNNGYNVNKCLAKLIMSVVPNFYIS